MNEQRKNGRARLDIFLNKYVGGVPYMTLGSDISSEGLGLTRLIEPSHAGKRVGLQFQLPGSDEVIYAEGEMVRGWEKLGKDPREEKDGVRFTLLTERHRRMIREYVSRHESA